MTTDIREHQLTVCLLGSRPGRAPASDLAEDAGARQLLAELRQTADLDRDLAAEGPGVALTDAQRRRIASGPSRRRRRGAAGVAWRSARALASRPGSGLAARAARPTVRRRGARALVGDAGRAVRARRRQPRGRGRRRARNPAARRGRGRAAGVAAAQRRAGREAPHEPIVVLEHRRPASYSRSTSPTVRATLWFARGASQRDLSGEGAARS